MKTSNFPTSQRKLRKEQPSLKHSNGLALQKDPCPRERSDSQALPPPHSYNYAGSTIGLFFARCLVFCLVASCHTDPPPPDPCPLSYVFQDGLHIRQFKDIACEEGDMDKAIKRLAMKYEQQIMNEALLVTRPELVDNAKVAKTDLAFTFKEVGGKKQRKLNRITQELRQHSLRADVKYQTFLVRHTKEPGLSNAWVIADGSIYITEALYDRFAEQEDIIAFILAHEMAHIENLAIDKKIALEKVIADKIGTGWFGTLAANSTKSLTTALQQYDELIADRAALYLMNEAGYDPRAGLAFFQFLEGASQAPSTFKSIGLLSRTHPYSHSRFNCLSHYLYESERRPAGCY